jgi:hypothetical protein
MGIINIPKTYDSNKKFDTNYINFLILTIFNKEFNIRQLELNYSVLSFNKNKLIFEYFIKNKPGKSIIFEIERDTFLFNSFMVKDIGIKQLQIFNKKVEKEVVAKIIAFKIREGLV